LEAGRVVISNIDVPRDTVVLALSKAVISTMTLALGIACETAKASSMRGIASEFVIIANLLHRADRNWTVLHEDGAAAPSVEGLGKPS
jgi:hypothetical protein